MKKNGPNTNNSLRNAPAVRNANSRPGTSSASNAGKNISEEPVSRYMTSTSARISTSASSKANASSSGKSASKKTSSGKSKKPKKSNKGAIIAVSIIAAIALIGVGIWFMISRGVFIKSVEVTNADGTVVEMKVPELREYLKGSDNIFHNGIIIDGVDVGGMTKEQALEALALNLPANPIELDIDLNLDDEIIDLDLSSLQIENNLPEVVNEAFEYARVNSTLASVDQLIAAYNSIENLKNAPATYQTSFSVNSEGAADIVMQTLAPLNAEVQEPEMTGFDIETNTFQFSESQTGYVIDSENAANQVVSMIDAATYVGVVDVQAQVTEPTITTEDLQAQYGMITESYSETTWNDSRNHNINITCQKIDGLILEPGETFSFNEEVGERTAANGYQMAGVINAGVLEQGYGGGICQVSSMIYQCAVKSLLEITQRWPHQWPSSYAEAGTDAAVDWGVQDLQITNNTEYPVVIRAFFDNDNRIVTVQFYGHLFENGEYYEFDGEVTSYGSSGPVEYIPDPDRPVGETEQVRAPHSQQTARGYRIHYSADGVELDREDLGPTYYGAISEQIEVGILNPDGTTCEMDTTTGIVVTPSPTPTPTPEVTPPPTDPSTQPSDTTVPPAETTPAPPPETTPAPPPPETQAPQAETAASA